MTTTLEPGSASASEVLRLRAAVAWLGELRGWWLSAVGGRLQQFERLFPRSAARAAAETLAFVGRSEHDARLSPRSFHLFRLPDPWEELIADELSRPTSVRAPSLQEVREVLGGFASPMATRVSGPVDLGVVPPSGLAPTLRSAASAYLAADRDETVVYPYFTV